MEKGDIRKLNEEVRQLSEVIKGLSGKVAQLSHVADEPQKPVVHQKLSDAQVGIVDEFQRRLHRGIREASKGNWGQPFAVASRVGYVCAKMGMSDNPHAPNWIQLNDRSYGHEYFRSASQYGNIYDWFVQARFGSCPRSGFWRKKAPYIHHPKAPLEWSLGGNYVWGISYEDMHAYLVKIGEGTLLPKLLADLRDTWQYVCKYYSLQPITE